MKEQLAKMTIIELVRTAHNYSTSIKQTGVYSELVREMASRLEALNLAHIGAMAALNSTENERDQLAAENAAIRAIRNDAAFITDEHYEQCPTEVQKIIGKLAVMLLPATARFLAEQRAQEAKRIYESILDNPAVVDMESLVDWLEQHAGDAKAFAAQLRNEVNHD
ncbi:hypothetical protein [Enterobacter sp. ENT03]|uniref:hypothetical protein n=1 Tax=Enterobacter sp. ENT03 TaxID=2854780 RepID=UPI001C45DDF1|nr:hypothetical protein [Enterobacter sp. ENT03]MBV7404504.1 hypothetical protein [Enterobacter sp. ENT03]